MFDKIVAMKESSREAVLKKYLQSRYKDKEIIIGKKFIEKSYRQKFQHACKKIEEITGRKLCRDNFKVWLTTMPRGPYFDKTGEIWQHTMWVNPIAGWMHEALHFQFHFYWRDIKGSPVNRLAEDSFQHLKESLTTVLDRSLIPLIEMPDTGYPAHQQFRKILHRHWARYHDFDKLVKYGLKKLPEFTTPES